MRIGRRAGVKCEIRKEEPYVGERRGSSVGESWPKYCAADGSREGAAQTEATLRKEASTIGGVTQDFRDAVAKGEPSMEA